MVKWNTCDSLTTNDVQIHMYMYYLYIYIYIYIHAYCRRRVDAKSCEHINRGLSMGLYVEVKSLSTIPCSEFANRWGSLCKPIYKQEDQSCNGNLLYWHRAILVTKWHICRVTLRLQQLGCIYCMKYICSCMKIVKWCAIGCRIIQPRNAWWYSHACMIAHSYAIILSSLHIMCMWCCMQQLQPMQTSPPNMQFIVAVNCVDLNTS